MLIAISNIACYIKPGKIEIVSLNGGIQKFVDFGNPANFDCDDQYCAINGRQIKKLVFLEIIILILVEFQSDNNLINHDHTTEELYSSFMYTALVFPVLLL